MTLPINPEAIWSERFADIGSVIEADSDLLIERFVQRACAEQSGAAGAHFDEMRNMLPALLRAVGRALAQSGDEVAVRHCLIAMQHGEQRWKVGWRLAEVVRDYQILRLVILDHLDRNLNHWPLTIRETMAIGLALDEAISASVLAYVNHQEQELRQANERQSEFLAVLGHELRNPLTAIVTTLQLLRLQKAVAPAHEEAYAVLDRQVMQLTRLLDDMLDVSRIARGKLQLSKEPIAAQELIRRAVETTGSLFAARGHDLEVVAPQSPVTLLVDPARVEQVLANLLTNAAKYTPPEGKVRVELDVETDHAVIRVSDNGVGISAEMLAKIFEMFAQAPEHRSQGLGIGLALAKTLLEMHGGSIAAHSDGPGAGSRFACRLPLASPHADRPVPLPAPLVPRTAPGDRFSILVIDDQVDALRELRLLLALFGHDVHLAHSGEEGLQQAAQVRPQVVLLDIRMPGMDGYETARRLRTMPGMETALIVAMSGYVQENDATSSDASFDARLLKPVSFETVQQLLAARQRAPEQPWN
jgi:signal transduction histidine kinase/ActR/RegA family two-component response regulator